MRDKAIVMKIDRTFAFLAAFCGGCLLVLSWTTCSVASELPVKDAGESIWAVHAAMEQSSLSRQAREPALDSKSEDADKTEESVKKSADEKAAVFTPLGFCLPSARIFFRNPPYLSINLPSWCGFIPYPLPPPACLPA